jgi:23S rRNA (cytosine1962-C5)-methyltransferase
MTEIAPLKLKKNQERRLRAGHCWIYSNEVDTSQTPLKGLQAGQAVDILSDRGKWLGSGYVNPNTLICARLVSRDPAHRLDQSLLIHRLNIALGLRDALFPAPYYRLVYGEADGLPGLIVDRYGDALVVQLTTAGMEALKDQVIAALDKVLRPAVIVLRNDLASRDLEGLEQYIEVAKGTVSTQTEVIEGDARFAVSLTEGQKTGWFYDQAANRDRLMKYVAGKRVLDVCSYVGAWGVRAALGGAASVTCVDVSASALEQAQANAELNAVAGKLSVAQGDAFSTLKAMRQAGEQFDVVVVDPPAFIKRRKDLKEGTLAYRRLNEVAMALLGREGLLASASCSFHMDRDTLLRTLQQGARHVDRSLQLLEYGQQGPDHPIHPAIAETAYLKAYYLRVLPTF